MKKTVAGLFTSLFALITLASCQNLENAVQGLDPSNAKKEYREVIITADISDNSGEDESSTRTELQMSGNQLKTYWVPGDAINVFSAGESAKFVSVNTEPSRKAKFRGYVAMMIGDDGETHQGVFDTAMLNSVPGAVVYSPCYFSELEHELHKAIYKYDGITAVRYPRGAEPYKPDDYVSGEEYTVYGNGKDAVVVTYGRIFGNACKAKEALKKNNKDITIIKLERIKPISREAVSIAAEFKKVYFFEEGIKCGGIGESFCCMLNELGFKGNFSLTAIDNLTLSSDTFEELRSVLIVGCTPSNLFTTKVVRLTSFPAFLYQRV